MATVKAPFHVYMSKALDTEKEILRATFGSEKAYQACALIARLQQCPHLTLGSSVGAMVSIQASEHHYSRPRENLPYKDYETFELGFPTLAYFSEQLLRPYADTLEDEPTGIYPHVPADVVQEYVDTLCGIRGFISMYDQQEYPLVITEQDISYYSLL